MAAAEPAQQVVAEADDSADFAPLEVLASHEPEPEAGAGGGAVEPTTEERGEATSVSELKQPPSDVMGEATGQEAD